MFTVTKNFELLKKEPNNITSQRNTGFAFTKTKRV